MSVQIITFEDVTQQEDWEIACECKWHTELNDNAAEWVVRHSQRPCGCCAGRVTLWCDPCLTAVTSMTDLLVRCHVCGETFTLGDVALAAEPINRLPEAA